MSAYRERAATFGPGGSIVGIVTVPREPDPTLPSAVVILNAGVIHRVGPNRLHVRLARELADRGMTVLRFDLSGIGDSEARHDENDLAAAVHRDVDAALEFLELELGAQSFIVFGMCSGANNAFRFGVADERVVAMALVDPVAFRTPWYYVAHYSRRLLRPEPWLNVLTGRHPAIRRLLRRSAPRGSSAPAPVAAELPEPTREEMARGLDALVARGTELLVVFTGGVSETYNYESQFADLFPRVARARGVRARFFRESDHTFSAEHDKAALIELVSSWLGGLRGRLRPKPRRNARHSPTVVERVAVSESDRA